MTTTNKARDLLLLAAVAFENKQFNEAGALFATALSSDDAPQLMETLNKLAIDEQTAVASAGEPRMSLREISKALSAAIEDTVGEQSPGVATASDDEDEDDESESDADEDADEDEDEESEDEESEEEDDDSDDEEDEDDDEESDDLDPDEGGEKILPSSISSATSPGTVKRKDGAASRLIISGVGGVNTPIKLKQ